MHQVGCRACPTCGGCSWRPIVVDIAVAPQQSSCKGDVEAGRRVRLFRGRFRPSRHVPIAPESDIPCPARKRSLRKYGIPTVELLVGCVAAVLRRRMSWWLVGLVVVTLVLRVPHPYGYIDNDTKSVRVAPVSWPHLPITCPVEPGAWHGRLAGAHPRRDRWCGRCPQRQDPPRWPPPDASRTCR